MKYGGVGKLTLFCPSPVVSRKPFTRTIRTHEFRIPTEILDHGLHYFPLLVLLLLQARKRRQQSVSNDEKSEASQRSCPCKLSAFLLLGHWGVRCFPRVFWGKHGINTTMVNTILEYLNRTTTSSLDAAMPLTKIQVCELFPYYHCRWAISNLWGGRNTMGKAVIACTRGGVHAINRKWIYSATTSADDGDGTDLFSRKAFRMFLAAPKFVSAPDKI